MSPPLAVFAGTGIEIEYMIVDAQRLDVLPLADHLLRTPGNAPVNELERGEMAWSNELTLHLVEVKNRRPGAPLTALATAFAAEVAEIDRRLAGLGARLMPGAMHPWMDPARETRLWPHAQADIYRAYDRVFGCRQHGFANLQSMHLNLPFADDHQFARLHAATRLLLPLLPALAASSPFVAGAPAGVLDARLQAYRVHQAGLPESMGALIPDSIGSRNEYQQRILTPMYRAVTARDPGGTLAHEWLNARACVPRFARMALEIRLLDSQENPTADLAVAAAVSAAIRRLYAGDTTTLAAQQRYPTAPLTRLLEAGIADAEQAVVEDPVYLGLLGLPPSPCLARDLWRRLIDDWWDRDTPARLAWQRPLTLILERGPLARRLLRAAGPAPAHARLHAVHRELCDCLASGHGFGEDR